MLHAAALEHSNALSALEHELSGSLKAVDALLANCGSSRSSVCGAKKKKKKGEEEEEEEGEEEVFWRRLESGGDGSDEGEANEQGREALRRWLAADDDDAQRQPPPSGKYASAKRPLGGSSSSSKSKAPVAAGKGSASLLAGSAGKGAKKVTPSKGAAAKKALLPSSRLSKTTMTDVPVKPPAPPEPTRLRMSRQGGDGAAEEAAAAASAAAAAAAAAAATTAAAARPPSKSNNFPAPVSKSSSRRPLVSHRSSAHQHDASFPIAAKTLYVAARTLSSDVKSLRSVASQAFQHLSNDLNGLASAFATSMCHIMQNEELGGPQQQQQQQQQPQRGLLAKNMPSTTEGPPSPARYALGRSQAAHLVHSQQQHGAPQHFEEAGGATTLFVPGGVLRLPRDLRLVAKTRDCGVDYGARLYAHVALAPEGLRQIVVTNGVSRLTIRADSHVVELGILKESEIDSLKVAFSRVFAIEGAIPNPRGSGTTLKTHVEPYNRNLIGELRPLLVASVQGAGPSSLCVVSSGGGAASNSGMMSSRLLEGSEGATGVMWECVRTLFNQLASLSSGAREQPGVGPGPRSAAFYRQLKVRVSAVEVLGGWAVDLLEASGGGGRKDGEDEDYCYDATAARSSGASKTMGASGWVAANKSKSRLLPATGPSVDPLKVEIGNCDDFNKLLGVIISMRGVRQRRNPFAQCIVKVQVVLAEDVWSELVFVDFAVPNVDDGVLYGNYEDYYEGEKKSQSHYEPPQQRNSRDMAYAKEDCSTLASLLERRISGGSSSDGKEGDGGYFDNCTPLAKLLGPTICSSSSAVRVFVNVSALVCDLAETRESASALLFASLALGDK